MERNDDGQFVSVEMVEKECPQCGETTEFYPSDAKRGRRFCSNECSRKHKSETLTGENHHNYDRETSTCKYCGDDFQHLPSKERQYCNGSCRNKDRDYPTGPDSPNWKGGVTPEIKRIRNSEEYDEWREAVFSRDNYTCQECGSSNKFLNAHHITPMSEDLSNALEVDNGLTLCVDCHQDRHPDTPLDISQSKRNATRE